MLESSSWDIVPGSASARTVLAVDFPVDGRRAAGLAELAVMLGSRYRFLRARPRSARPEDGLSADSYTQSWIEHLRQDGQPVLAVIGHGVGCGYAVEIAAAVGRWQPPPAVILFDPEPTGTGLLSRALSAAVAANEAILSAGEIERARRLAAEFATRPGRLASLACEIVETYLDVLAEPWERVGLGELRDSEFARSFASHIALLTAASQLERGNTWDRSTVIMSADHAGMLEHGHSIGRFGDPDRRRILLDVDHASLLRSDCVAGAVLELLGTS